MTAIFMVIMLLAQIGIAQHNVVHFTDHGHYEQSDDNHDSDDHKKSASESCQICLLTKSLSLGLLASHEALPAPAFANQKALKGDDSIASNHRTTPYNPRAPPTLLI